MKNIMYVKCGRNIKNAGTWFVLDKSKLSATIYPELKHTLVAMSEHTGLSISEIMDKVLYDGLAEMQALEGLERSERDETRYIDPRGRSLAPPTWYIKLLKALFLEISKDATICSSLQTTSK